MVPAKETEIRKLKSIRTLEEYNRLVARLNEAIEKRTPTYPKQSASVCRKENPWNWPIIDGFASPLQARKPLDREGLTKAQRQLC